MGGFKSLHDEFGEAVSSSLLVDLAWQIDYGPRKEKTIYVWRAL